jgi:hypothetical protein
MFANSGGDGSSAFRNWTRARSNGPCSVQDVRGRISGYRRCEIPYLVVPPGSLGSDTSPPSAPTTGAGQSVRHRASHGARSSSASPSAVPRGWPPQRKVRRCEAYRGYPRGSVMAYSRKWGLLRADGTSMDPETTHPKSGLENGDASRLPFRATSSRGTSAL